MEEREGGAEGRFDLSPDPPTFQPGLVALQRRDALAVARAIEPRKAFPLRWLRRPILLAAALLAATGALIVLPNRMDAVLEERRAVAQAATEQAERIEDLRQGIERAQELSPEEREELLRQLAQLAEQLRANPGDLEEALADLSKVEESLRKKLDPNADARQAVLEALAAQFQSLAEGGDGEKADPSAMSESLEKLAEKLAEMSAEERQALAKSLSQMAARAGQAGDADLAQALAALAQAAQSGDVEMASQAVQSVAEAMSQAQRALADQEALQCALAQLRAGRQAMSQAGEGGQATAQVPGSGQDGGQGQGDGQGDGDGDGAGQGQGQGQGGQGTGGQGTKADKLPPGTGTGLADRPQGEGPPGGEGDLDQQVYVPWERRQGSGDEVVIPGQDSGEGETQVRERKDPLPGAPGEALVPYHEVYYSYLDAANQAVERSYIPSGLKEYVKEYFARLEP